ncbi:hypothetical protein [Pseudomonas veronii]
MTQKPLIDRLYTIELHKMPEFVDVFDLLAMPILLETLGTPFGFYTSVSGHETSGGPAQSG